MFESMKIKEVLQGEKMYEKKIDCHKCSVWRYLCAVIVKEINGNTYVCLKLKMINFQRQRKKKKIK